MGLCFSHEIDLFWRDWEGRFCRYIQFSLGTMWWRYTKSPDTLQKSSLASTASRSASAMSTTPFSSCKEPPLAHFRRSLLASPKVEGAPPASKPQTRLRAEGFGMNLGRRSFRYRANPRSSSLPSNLLQKSMLSR